jgi:multidrug efflux pump subunit AcrB
LQLPIPGGRNLPLLDVASLEYTLEQPLIWRRDRLPTITVQADLSPGIEAKTVTAQLAAKIADFARTLPAGYRIETGMSARRHCRPATASKRVARPTRAPRGWPRSSPWFRS